MTSTPLPDAARLARNREFLLQNASAHFIAQVDRVKDVAIELIERSHADHRPAWVNRSTWHECPHPCCKWFRESLAEALRVR